MIKDSTHKFIDVLWHLPQNILEMEKEVAGLRLEEIDTAPLRSHGMAWGHSKRLNYVFLLVRKI